MASRGAARNGRGGYQPPANPAPVSGPGALSQRTDSQQPIRPAANDGGYGDRKAAVQQQQAAPMRQGDGMPDVPIGTGPAGAMPSPPAVNDPFGPTNRPYEPVTAGATLGAGPSGPNQAEGAYQTLLGVLQAHPEAADSINAILEELSARR